MNGSRKNCLFVHQSSPHGSANPVESMDMAYTLSAFEHDVSFLFMQEGIFQLMRDQKTEGLDFKDFAPAFKAWEDFEIKHIYVEQQAMDEFNITPDQLLVPVEVISAKEISDLFSEHQFIFTD